MLTSLSPSSTRHCILNYRFLGGTLKWQGKTCVKTIHPTRDEGVLNFKERGHNDHLVNFCCKFKTHEVQSSNKGWSREANMQGNGDTVNHRSKASRYIRPLKTGQGSWLQSHVMGPDPGDRESWERSECGSDQTKFTWYDVEKFYEENNQVRCFRLLCVFSRLLS